MNDTPGRMLSSQTGGGDKQHPKLGDGCVGVFFQMFDWNRRFSGNRFFANKLLPAEGRKHVPIKFRDEKLPMAKLIPIADENRGGFPNAKKHPVSESTPSKDVFDNGATSRCKPGVVARLMGLESMPISDSQKEGKEEAKQHREAMETGPIQDLLHGSQNPMLEEMRSVELKRPSLRRKLNEFVRNSSEVCLEKSEESTKHALSRLQSDVKVANAVSTLARHVAKTSSNRLDDPAVSLFSRLPPLSPCAESPLRSILSSSKRNNKLASPIRSPLAAKRATQLFEAAARILEPNMQPTNRLRRSTITPVRRSLLKESDIGKDKCKKPTRNIGASNEGSANIVRALKDQPLSKSWSGPSVEQVSQINSRNVRKGGKASSSRLGFMSSLVQRVHRSQEIGSQVKAEHCATPSIAKRHEKEKPTCSANEFESRHKERECIALRKGRLASVNLPGGQGLFHRSGNVKEEMLATSTPHLGRSKSAKEGRSKVTAQQVSGEAHQLLSVGHMKIQPVSNIVVKQEQRTRKFSEEVGTVVGKKNGGTKQGGCKHRRDANPPRGKASSSDAAVSANGSHQNASSHSGSDDIPFEFSVQLANEPSSCNVGSNSIVINNCRPLNSGTDGKIVKNGKDDFNDLKRAQGRGNSFLRSLQRRRTAKENAAFSERISTECKLLNAKSSLEPKSTGIKTEKHHPARTQEFNRLSCMSVENVKFEDADLSGYGISEVFSGGTMEDGAQTLVSHRLENWMKSRDLETYRVKEDHLSDYTIEGGIIGRNITSSSVRSPCSSIDSTYPTELAEISWERSESSSEANHGIWRDFAGSTQNADSDFTYMCSDVTSKWSEVGAAQYSSQGSCDLFGDLRDTASTNDPWELNCNGNENFSLSGKHMALKNSGPIFPVTEQFKTTCGSSSSSDYSGYCQGDQSSTIDEDSQKSSVGCQEQLPLLAFSGVGDCGSSGGNYKGTKVSVDKQHPAKSGVCWQESFDSSDSMPIDDSCLHSPISILESPFQDESSNSSENSDSGQGSKYSPQSSRQSRDIQHPEQSDPASSEADSAFRDPVSNASLAIRSEEEYVRAIIDAAAKSDDSELLDTPLIDATLFIRLESKLMFTELRWGTSSQIYSSDQEDSKCNSLEVDRDVGYRDTHDEIAGWQNRKLIFDCANEALTSKLNLYKDGGGFFCQGGSPSLLHAASRPDLARSVYKQMKDWRAMGESLTPDELVEMDMNRVSGTWANVHVHNGEVTELRVEIERYIFGLLMEELMSDLVRLPHHHPPTAAAAAAPPPPHNYHCRRRRAA